jgi:hypothetical protein
MQIRVGFEMLYEFVGRTPMVLMLNVHPSRALDVIKPDHLRIAPSLPVTRYADAFGNICTRLVAPPGQVEISTDALVWDSGLPEPSSRTRASTRWLSCRTTRWCSCWRADTARPTA